MGSISKIRRTAKKLTIMSGGTLDVSNGTVTGMLKVPTTGTTGYVLTKTANGAAFAALPKAAAISDVTGTYPTKAEFNALLAAMRTAGLMATVNPEVSPTPGDGEGG